MLSSIGLMVIWMSLSLVTWKLRYIMLAQRSDVVLNQTDGRLVSKSREVEIKVHLVGSEVRCCCPRSG